MSPAARRLVGRTSDSSLGIAGLRPRVAEESATRLSYRRARPAVRTDGWCSGGTACPTGSPCRHRLDRGDGPTPVERIASRSRADPRLGIWLPRSAAPVGLGLHVSRTGTPPTYAATVQQRARERFLVPECGAAVPPECHQFGAKHAVRPVGHAEHDIQAASKPFRRSRQSWSPPRRPSPLNPVPPVTGRAKSPIRSAPSTLRPCPEQAG